MAEEQNTKTYKCVARFGRVVGLTAELRTLCAGRVLVGVGDGRFKLYTGEEYEQLLEKLRSLERGEVYLRAIAGHAQILEQQEDLLPAVYRAFSCQYGALPDDAALRLRFFVSEEKKIELLVERIEV